MTRRNLASLDARVKLGVSLGWVVATASLRSVPATLLALGGTGALLAASGVRMGRLATRALWVLPFAGGVALAVAVTAPGEALATLGGGRFGLSVTAAGLREALALLLRVTAAAWAAAFLTETTRLDETLRALRWAGMPPLLTDLAGLVLREGPALHAELERMGRAREARAGGGRGPLRPDTLDGAGALVGMLFTRCLHRSERLYRSMLARGLGGRGRGLPGDPVPPGQVLAGVALAAAGLLILGWDRGWIG
ncbi:cobalt ECF transporter T component CbiQ [Limnochorda pilosa]|uniref:Cobalt ABC transporter permease n=1 Tax=Limnochorda pilosa TaxID=1555112 RepID=A0A0K2SHI4_LIMPI|nr:cobalt ECF transporter T component CbiQ [Limnochorda pilosa]BAS26497.1 cobalt ABC transporter permease [Limnochorda pilosa]